MKLCYGISFWQNLEIFCKLCCLIGQLAFTRHCENGGVLMPAAGFLLLLTLLQWTFGLKVTVSFQNTAGGKRCSLDAMWSSFHLMLKLSVINTAFFSSHFFLIWLLLNPPFCVCVWQGIILGDQVTSLELLIYFPSAGVMILRLGHSGVYIHDLNSLVKGPKCMLGSSFTMIRSACSTWFIPASLILLYESSCSLISSLFFCCSQVGLKKIYLFIWLKWSYKQGERYRYSLGSLLQVSARLRLEQVEARSFF